MLESTQGQAESGKSTLQKQFQVLYAPESLEIQRASWRPVVYLNALKSVRTILDGLDSEEDIAYLSDKSNGEYQRSSKAEAYQRQLHSLQLRLAPLLSVEELLSLDVATTGHGLSTASRGPLVRAGWASQDHENENDFHEEMVDDRDPYGPSVARNVSNETVMARLFLESAEHIHELWHHPVVWTMIKRRRLRLEDSGEL
jgi:hypothetical protein